MGCKWVERKGYRWLYLEDDEERVIVDYGVIVWVLIDWCFLFFDCLFIVSICLIILNISNIIKSNNHTI